MLPQLAVRATVPSLLQVSETIKRSPVCQIVRFEDNIQRNLTKAAAILLLSANWPIATFAPRAALCLDRWRLHSRRRAFS